MKNKPNLIPGTEHLVDTMARCKALLDFIDKEPVMKWLLYRADKARQAAGKNVINGCLGEADYEGVVLMTQPVAESQALIDDLPTGTVEEVAALIWGMTARKGVKEGWEWAIQGRFIESTPHNDLFPIGKELNVQKIIEGLKLNGHEVMEAEKMYGIDDLDRQEKPENKARK